VDFVVSGNVNVSNPVTVISRRVNNTSVTLLNSNQNSLANQRMSVFEPYPMRDTIQHFCEKHLDKIKAYMDKVSIRIPSPAKCTIEEKRQKKSAKLHFACQGGGQHCLYSKTYFTMRTRNPRIWIHLMFISLQARHTHALSSRDTQVASLKHCWDMLKCENKSFLTVVTSAFPCPKDQDTLINELRHSGYFDVFQICPQNVGGSADQLDGGSFKWGCFLCAHPERAVGFLRGNSSNQLITASCNILFRRHSTGHRGPTQGKERTLAPFPEVEDEILYPLGCPLVLQRLGKSPQLASRFLDGAVSERRRVDRRQPNQVGEGVSRGEKHSKSVRDLHREPNADLETERREERRRVGPVFEHRRGALPC
jgi:hypothetical protein